jgi:hypothetical protein
MLRIYNQQKTLHPICVKKIIHNSKLDSGIKSVGLVNSTLFISKFWIKKRSIFSHIKIDDFLSSTVKSRFTAC